MKLQLRCSSKKPFLPNLSTLMTYCRVVLPVISLHRQPNSTFSRLIRLLLRFHSNQCSNSLCSHRRPPTTPSAVRHLLYHSNHRLRSSLSSFRTPWVTTRERTCSNRWQCSNNSNIRLQWCNNRWWPGRTRLLLWCRMVCLPVVAKVMRLWQIQLLWVKTHSVHSPSSIISSSSSNINSSFRARILSVSE